MNSIDARLYRLMAACGGRIYSPRQSSDDDYAEGMQRYKQRRAKEIKRALRKLEKPSIYKSEFDSTEIYFIECGDFIKIGHSITPGHRLAGIGTGNPHPVVLLHTLRGTVRDEKLLHEQFAHLWHRGEWFRRDAELIAFIEKLKAAQRAALSPEINTALEVAEARRHPPTRSTRPRRR